MDKYIVFRVNGGIGKNIMASAVAKAIAREYPDRKIVVTTSWIEPWINNPNIYRVYKNDSMPYFYDDFVKDKDTLFFCEEPYNSHGYLSGLSHLTRTWCDCINVPYNGELPQIYLTPEEIRQASIKFMSDRPIMIIQPFGGMNKRFPYSWNRDIPYHQAQLIVNETSKKYNVIQLGTNGTQKLNRAIMPEFNLREALSLIRISNCRILIDSFAQHAAAAFNLPSTVCWITNSSEVFGYNMHKNIFARKDNISEGISTYFGAEVLHDFTGSRIHDYPFKDNNVFNVEEILNSISSDSI